MEHHLTEKAIQQVSLQFLKAYYKQREREGETQVTQDMVTPSGIIADGYLQFIQPDNKLFVATLEATSADKIGEVRYAINVQYLIWESFATSVLLTAFLMGFGFAQDWFTLWANGWLESIAIAVTCTASLMILYQIFFRDIRRYRYIYAIEQFKQYHADEQWIGLGADVFPIPGDRYFEEVKRQCVVNGFGLLLIQMDGLPQLLITPARVEMFGGYRQILSFFNLRPLAAAIRNNPLIQRLPKVPALKLGDTPLTARLQAWAPRQFNEVITVNYNRYMKAYWKQRILSGIAFLMLIAVFYREYQTKPVHFTNERAYEKQLLERSKQMEGQSETYMLEKDYTVPYNSANSDAYLPDTTADEIYTSEPVVQNEPEEPVGISPGLYLFADNTYVSYDCERLNMTGEKYVVQFASYKTFPEAREKINMLNEFGYIANAISLKCINGQTGYIVFFELFYNSKENAIAKGKKVKASLKEDGFGTLPIKVIRVNFG